MIRPFILFFSLLVSSFFFLSFFFLSFFFVPHSSSYVRIFTNFRAGDINSNEVAQEIDLEEYNDDPYIPRYLFLFRFIYLFIFFLFLPLLSSFIVCSLNAFRNYPEGLKLVDTVSNFGIMRSKYIIYIYWSIPRFICSSFHFYCKLILIFLFIILFDLS